MKTFEYYFVDRNGYGGSAHVTAKNIREAKKKVNEYIRLWRLAPVSYLQVIEIIDSKEAK